VHTAAVEMARGSTPKSASKAKRGGGHEEWMDDEVDAHHRSRDKISLDPADDSDDDEDDFDEDAGVMDIDADDSEDDSEDEDDSDDEDDEGDDDDAGAGAAYDDDDDLEGDDDEAALIRAMKSQQKKLNASSATRARRDSDDDESESESDEDGPGIRGKSKADFYGDDDVDHEGMSDEEDREGEEREARRLQRERGESMRAADYGLDDSEDDSDEDSEEATLGAKAKRLGAEGKAKAKAREEKKKAAKKTKANAAAGAAIESLGGDELASAGANVVASDAPELIALTKELTKNLDEVRASVEPVVAAARAGEYATAEGISYLDAKHLLMLSYCINIVFYLLLKAEGKPVRDHPVVLRLVEIRTYLEKLRPIDRKLRYQIDKLLKMADEGAAAGDGAEPTDDPLQFRPNPDALVSKVDEDAEEGGGEGVYRPPKMLPTAMDDFEEGGKSAKEKRKEKEARRRASRSALIKVRRGAVESIVSTRRECEFDFSAEPSRRDSPRSGLARDSPAPAPAPPLASSFFGHFRRCAAPWRMKATFYLAAESTRTKSWAGYRSNTMSGVPNQELDIHLHLVSTRISRTVPGTTPSSASTTSCFAAD
jgi:U3 small nucleolar RNA-associated protein 3